MAGGVKVLKAQLELQAGKFLAGVKQANQGVKGFQKETKSASSALGTLKDKAAAGFGSIAKSIAGVAAAYAGFSAVKSFLSESESAAMASIEADTKLQTVLRNTIGAREDEIQSLRDLAGAQQALGVVDDDAQLSGMQTLAVYGLQVGTIATLTEGMNDLLVQQKGLNVSQEDAVTVAKMLGKAMDGSTGALAKAGVQFTAAQERMIKYGNEQQRAATIAEALKNSVGGVNAALAGTDQGRIKQLNNAWGDLQETVGGVVLQVKGRFAGFLAQFMPRLQDKVERASGWIVSAMDRAEPYIEGIKGKLDMVGSGFTWLKNQGVAAFEQVKAKVAEHQPTLDGVKRVVGDIRDGFIWLKEKAVEAFDGIKPYVNEFKSNLLPGVVDGVAFILDRAVALYDFGKSNWPKVVAVVDTIKSGIGNVLNKATSLYNFIKSNWSVIEPIVGGIAAAVAAYGVKLGIAAAKTQVLAAKTAILAAKTFLLKGGLSGGIQALQGNLTAFAGVLKGGITAAVGAIGWVPIAIGVAVAAGIWLYRNWDTISTKAKELWSGIKDKFGGIKQSIFGTWDGAVNAAKNAWNGITSTVEEGKAAIINKAGELWQGVKGTFAGVKTFFSDTWNGAVDAAKGAWNGIGAFVGGVWDGLSATVRGGINAVFKPVNQLIDNLNRIKVKVPDWSPFLRGKEFGVNIPKIPEFASGTSYFRGGQARINERGGEIVNLPGGSQVIPADKSAKMVQGREINLTFHFHGTNITADEIMAEVVPRLKLALSNM